MATNEGRLGETLRAYQEQFAGHFGNAPIGVVTTSLDAGEPSRYLAVNDSFCQQTGYSWMELNGKDFLGIVHPQDQPALDEQVDSIAAGSADRISTDVRIVDRDGNELVNRVTGDAIAQPDGTRYLAMFWQDMTATARTQAELRQLEDELAQSRRWESLGQLTEGIAHDFNNLLTVISSYSSLVHDEITVAEASQGTSRWGPVRWDVRQIEEAADRAKRLVKHLMAFTRREEAEPVIADPGDQIADATGLLDEVLGDHIAISARPGRALWQVRVDPGMFKQAIINIALNARDAMPAGGQIDITVDNLDTATTDLHSAYSQTDLAEFAELLPGRYVLIRISDTGVGMDPVIAERAFEPFFTTKSDDDAAGLGLSAVRRFAARSGGRAWLTSQAGHGTTVTLMVPTAPGSTTTKPLAGTGQERSIGTIVVVDDEPAIRDVAHRVLTSAGYRVVTAANGPDALTLLADPAVAADILLADVVMPGITAQEFLSRAKELRPAIRVLFMSGYERPDEAPGWPEGGIEVIAKPFTRPTLLVRIQQAMAAGAERAAKPTAR